MSVQKKELQHVLTAVDHGANKLIEDTGSRSSKVAGKIGLSFSKLGGLVGGEVQEAFEKLGEAGEAFEHKGLADKLTGIGAAAMGAGGVLTQMGDKETAASNQLSAAIKATGGDAEEFDKQIEGTVGHMEKYGFSAVTTKDALTKLTNATQDPKKAIGLMGEAADLAASRHISLTSAADQLGKVLAGKGTRILAQYHVEIQKNADGSKNWDKTNAILAQRLSGQADAAAHTFTGRLKALRTEVEDNVAEFGQKYGPAILAAGTVLTSVAPVMKGAASLAKRIGSGFTSAGTEATTASAEIGRADAAIVTANTEAAGSAEELAAANKQAGATSGGVAGLLGTLKGAGGVAIGVAALGLAINSVTNNLQKTTQLKGPMGALIGKFGVMNEDLDKSGLLTDAMRKKLEESTKTEHDHEIATDGNATALEKQANKFGASTDAIRAATDAQSKNAASAAQATLEMRLENDAVDIVSQAFDKLNGKTIDVEQANIEFKNAVHNATSAIKDNGRSLEDNTAKGRENVSNVLDAITAAQHHAEAVAKQTGSTDKATAAYNRDITALGNHMTKVTHDKDAVDALIKKYGHVPKFVTTQLDMRDRANAKLDAAVGKLHKLTSKTWTFSVDGTVQFLNANNGSGSRDQGGKAEAGGTDFFPGGSTTIAEREPEIVLDRGAKVVPLSRWRGNGGAGSPVQVNIMTPQIWAGNNIDLQRLVAGLLERHVASGGRLNIGRGVFG